ncbi:hypothetical protein MNB_SV-13-73 [hydrothermal vent metagenome]|uniref:AAA+ ATPase domain-containing protein n=1 Tax=hydrothermal vent metagenome TaxID=652676 RepID=A0A1W1CZN8_9ZZZZ
MIDNKDTIASKFQILHSKVKKLKNEKKYISTLKKKEHELVANTPIIGLSEVNIENYKKLKNLQISKLKRINIFAGLNNSGKTSLLEAISLLINHNDIYHFLDMQRRRGKFSKLNPLWLDDEFQEIIQIDGKFEDIKSYSRFFSYTDERFYTKINIICNNAYSSPFSIQNKSDLSKHYARAVEKDILNDILIFIQKHIDKDLKDIRFIDKYVSTFKVNHKHGTRDLSSFGEGLQRVFYIALQFASAQNGVILIDELENGLHYTLLEDFTRFIQELAIKLNVQVFLTTHSKETIEAFVSNGFENEDISYYLMLENKRENRVKAIHYKSELLIKELEEHQEVRGW